MHSSFSMRWDGTKCGKEETRINIPQKKKKKKRRRYRGEREGVEVRYRREQKQAVRTCFFVSSRCRAEQCSAVSSRLVCLVEGGGGGRGSECAC